MNNGVAKALHVIGILVIIIGIIGAFMLGAQGSLSDRRYVEFYWPVFIAGSVISVISGMILYGFGEIIMLLDDCRGYLKKVAGGEEELPPIDSAKDNKSGEDDLPTI